MILALDAGRRLIFEDVDQFNDRRKIANELDVDQYLKQIERKIREILTKNKFKREKVVIGISYKIFEYLSNTHYLGITNAGLQVLNVAIYFVLSYIDQENVLPEEKTTTDKSKFNQRNVIKHNNSIKVLTSSTKEYNPLLDPTESKFKCYHYYSNTCSCQEVFDGIDYQSFKFKSFVENNVDYQNESFDKLMDELRRNMTDNLKFSKISAYMIVMSKNCAKRRIEEVFAFFIIVQAQYLYMNCVYSMFRGNMVSVINGFEEFNDAFNDLQLSFDSILEIFFHRENQGKFCCKKESFQNMIPINLRVVSQIR